jgi:hypothetical protein
MRNGTNRLRRGLALATVISAIAAPTAGAAPIDPAGTQANLPTDDSYSSVTALSPPASSPTPNAEPTVTAGDGFDWGDAGIGAASMLALTAIAAGAAVGLGYKRDHSVA